MKRILLLFLLVTLNQQLILVKMLERPETAQLEDDGNGNDLASGHYRWTFGGVAQ
jgi:hypothetical protein